MCLRSEALLAAWQLPCSVVRSPGAADHLTPFPRRKERAAGLSKLRLLQRPRQVPGSPCAPEETAAAGLWGGGTQPGWLAPSPRPVPLSPPSTCLSQVWPACSLRLKRLLEKDGVIVFFKKTEVQMT